MKRFDEMASAKQRARGIFRDWCEFNGLVIEPLAAADLVARIEAALRFWQKDYLKKTGTVGAQRRLKVEQETHDDPLQKRR